MAHTAQQEAIAREQKEMEKQWKENERQWQENERQWAWKEQQVKTEAAQHEKALAQAQVNGMLSIGVRPDEELIAQSGYTQQYIDSMWTHYQSV